MQKFFLQMFVISQKINILTKLPRTSLTTVMQILKQFGSETVFCSRYKLAVVICLAVKRLSQNTLLTTSLQRRHFVKKKFF